MRNSRLYFLNCWFSQFTLKLLEKKNNDKKQKQKQQQQQQKNTHTKRPQDSHSRDMYYLKYGTFRAKKLP